MTDAELSAMYDKAAKIERDAWSLSIDISTVTGIVDGAKKDAANRLEGIQALQAEAKLLHREIDRLHDECNARAKEQEETEAVLKKAIGIEIFGNPSTLGFALLAASRIEFLEGEVVRMSDTALASDYKYGIGMMVGATFVAACGTLAWLLL
jgi:hypothetical protein